MAAATGAGLGILGVVGSKHYSRVARPGRVRTGATNVLVGNHLTTSSTAICPTHLAAFGLFQSYFEMLTGWQVTQATLLCPPSLYFICFSLGHISRLEGGWEKVGAKGGSSDRGTG
jgi:hypothetical protein